LLRCLREPGFDNTKLPPSVDDVLTRIRKLPVPSLHTQTVDILKRRKQKVEVVGAQQIYYFDIEETLRRAFADPMVRATLHLDPPSGDPLETRKFRDSLFAHNPIPISKLVSFHFVTTEGKGEDAFIGDFVRLAMGEVMLVTRLEPEGDGSLTIVGEQWYSAKDSRRHRLADRELLRTNREVRTDPDSVMDRLTVYSSQAEHKEHRDNTAYWSCSELPARGAARSFNLTAHRNQLKEVLSIPVSVVQGRHIFIKVFLDGDCSVATASKIHASVQIFPLTKRVPASWGLSTLK